MENIFEMIKEQERLADCFGMAEAAYGHGDWLAGKSLMDTAREHRARAYALGMKACERE